MVEWMGGGGMYVRFPSVYDTEIVSTILEIF